MFERWTPFLISIVVIAMIIAPYLFAVQMTDAESVFSGFLINPIDGHSYLAKMQQGLQGNWRFVLPYTSEPGEGAYLFLFYLGLGHLSRILALPLLVVFHGFRILGAIFLLGVLYTFNNRIFQEKLHQNIGFGICAIGSGLGWIAVFAGRFTSDFWVAEAYPFLSMYTNPHFSIGLALMILALMPERKENFLWDLILGIGLGIIQPFAVVIVLIVKFVQLSLGNLKGIIQDRKIFDDPAVISTIAFGFGGGLILVYQYWSILNDPVLSLWNDQNITESPGYMDLILSFSPCLILAVAGIKKAWQEENGKALVIWAVASLVLVLIPWNLQRRFLTGLFVPLAGLAVYGLIQLERTARLTFRTGALILLVLSIPTNIIVIASGIQAAAKQDPKIYQERAVYQGLTWINDNIPSDSLILANEEVGLLIPAITGRRVLYGHPFETVNAGTEQEFLRKFIEENQDNSFYEKSIIDKGIDSLFLFGEISENLENFIISNGYTPDFENDLVRIIRVGQ